VTQTGNRAEAVGGEAAAGGSPAAAAFRLDKRTHLNGQGYRGSFILYGDGLAEVSFGFVSTIFKSTTPRGLSEKREENEERAVRRARVLLRRKILSSGADHLLTLTYRDNVVDLKRANSDLTVFLRWVKRRTGPYPYVAVAERQQRGAWHWHLAVCGWQDIPLLRSTWREVVGEGNIDVQAPRSSPAEHPRLAIVKYLAKYLGKTFGEEGDLNARRFRSSRISVPEKRKLIPALSSDEAKDYCMSWLTQRGGAVGYFVYSENTASGWGCSW
jgi:hypothetical protein